MTLFSAVKFDRAAGSGQRICARWLAVLAALLLSVATGVISTPLRAEKVVSVDQVTDLSAVGTQHMFRFVPNLSSSRLAKSFRGSAKAHKAFLGLVEKYRATSKR